MPQSCWKPGRSTGHLALGSGGTGAVTVVDSRPLGRQDSTPPRTANVMEGGPELAQAQPHEPVTAFDFEASAQEHLPELLGAAVRMTCDPDRGRDLCCEALVQAHKSFDEGRASEDSLKWLLVILAHTYVRSPEFARCRKGGLGDSRDTSRGTRPSSIADSRAAKLESALRSLPDESRLPVLLHDVEGLAYADIAQALGIPVGSVRSRIFRGRKQLQELLG